nr:hypothetical protein Hi04_10k_c1000_00029 [uncultured bacterium]
MRVVTRSFSVFSLLMLAVLAVPSGVSAKPRDRSTFQLVPADATLLPCLSGNDGQSPSVEVIVRHGLRNDHLRLVLNHIKSGLHFDLFTIQRSPLLADGTADPAFAGFGLAWYQTDAKTFNHPSDAEIDTILLDQIFGMDADATVNLPATQTLHLGLWFDDPKAAAACGFSGSTPFNGQHQAGPLAFVSLPDGTTGLGPLCTHPDTSTVPATCKP